jgi:UDP-N-acetylmuramoyl-tripeptide--D-alanyl-D-alanine ligase
MRTRRLSEVASAVGGRIEGEDVSVARVATDSRDAAPGSLFVAIRGPRADGAAFISDAFANGAAAAMVPGGVSVDGPAVVVGSTTDGLLALAADERSASSATVVAVTGANGKTSTKDLAAATLATSFRTHASLGSFNNEIGLPITLLTSPADAEVIVAELGARHPGDVARLCEVARPDIVVVTNVGVAHIEIFGSWNAIVEASAEPVIALGGDGVAILNADDPVVAGYAARTAARIVTFGVGRDADVRADEVRLDDDGCASFLLVTDGDHEQVELAVPGEHMVANALAAAATASVFGLSAAECAAGLKGARISHWRMETFTTADGIRVVNDAYNANPESMAAALKASRWMARGARLIAVLGVMAELGAIAEQEHEKVGELAARIRVDRLITVGDEARTIANAGLREGVEPENVAAYDGAEDALDDVREHARPGDVVLFKASRVAGLERLAEALR